ncbi:hypothetical protein GCM10009759_16260 [Kitasatospora saccharophila]|uniref:Peptidase S8/S53 domain-containing protein n=1 Tax=Kitasatospora saccharophila TaxID=407973 RepID=A0ABN2WGT9_9ACTN
MTAAPTSTGPCSNSYCIASGTSDATAYVSAAAALVFAKYPELTPGQVAERLVKTAAAPAGASQLPCLRYGYGVVRPYEALTANVPAGSPQGPPAAGAGTGATPSVTVGTPGDSGSGAGTGSGGLSSPGAVSGIKQPLSGSSSPLIVGATGALAVLLVVVVALTVANGRKRRRPRSNSSRTGRRSRRLLCLPIRAAVGSRPCSGEM